MIDLISQPLSRIEQSLEGGTGPGGDETRIDLHVHSHASGFATNWWVRGLGLGIETRESYTTPDEVWTRARASGMNLVTLTDHESLDGCQELLGHAEFVSGIEVNATFPDDQTTVDVLVYGLTMHDYREIQARRPDVYRLVAYLREANLVHVLAHPLFDLGNRLGRAQIEKRMVLFGCWEWINGARPETQNRLAARIAAATDAASLREIARRHGLPQPFHRRISGTAGSDDHGGLHIGRAWTRLPKVTSVADLLEAMRAGETLPCGESGSVNHMVHTGFAIAANAVSENQDAIAAPESLSNLKEILPLVPMLSAGNVRQLLASRYEARVNQSLSSGGGGFPTLQAISSIGRLVEGHLLVAPYVGIHTYFAGEARKADLLAREFGLLDGPLHIGVVVDDLDEIHGVATMYRNLELVSRRHPTAQVALVRCSGDAASEADVPHMRAIAELPLPLYPGRALGVPSVLEVFDHLAAANYDVVHIATPGPLGLAFLFAATTLGIPVIGAYHTEYAAYARTLSGDHLLGDIVEGVVREFYRRCSAIAASSQATARALQERGFGDRIAVLRNGVDSELLAPDQRDEALHARLGGGRTLLLFVGRVSREKDLDWLASGYRNLRARRDDVHLVIVGDGPHRADLEQILDGAATFTGFLQGHELARTIASCDVFLFPSTTDTLGRAVLEAQACGLPAVVRDAGGASECLLPGVSGYVVPVGDDDGYWAAVESLIDDVEQRRHLSQAARDFAVQRTWADVLDGFLALCRTVARREETLSEPAYRTPIEVAV